MTGWSAIYEDHVLEICYGISVVFLALTICCFIFVPKLREQGGLHHMSISIAYFIHSICSFFKHVAQEYVRCNYGLCISMVLGVQYGLFATNCWLNIMCFEIWRKIRILVKYQTAKTFPDIFFQLYGWGLPSILIAITVLMEFVAPDGYRPIVDTKRCWFEDREKEWTYYFGPIALLNVGNMALLIPALINKRTVLKKYKEASNDVKTLGCSTKKLSNTVLEFHQVFKIFTLAVFFGSTWVLSMVIPPDWLWAPVDCFNDLLGLFIFIILLTSTNRRKLIEEKCPFPFKLARRIKQILCKLKHGWSDEGNRESPTANISTISDSVSIKTTTSTLELSYTPSQESLRF